MYICSVIKSSPRAASCVPAGERDIRAIGCADLSDGLRHFGRLEPADERQPAEARADTRPLEPVHTTSPGAVMHAVPDRLRPELEARCELSHGEELVSHGSRTATVTIAGGLVHVEETVGERYR